MSEQHWHSDLLKQFKEADDMHVSPFYDDGQTLGTPTWIWSVVVDGKLFVRAYNGQNSRWYQSAKDQQAGQIQLAQQTFDVQFIPVPGDKQLDESINGAYKEKYGNSAYLPPMLEPGPVSATVKIEPK